MRKLIDIAVIAAVALTLYALSKPTPKSLPPVIQSFLDAHPNLGFKLRDVEVAPDWAEGKRWRAISASGYQLIIYEKNGGIESVRYRGAYLWDRQGRHKQ